MTIDFLRGLASGVLLAMAAVAATWFIVDRIEGRHARPLAELIVDLLYRRAIRAAALARAADAALVRYRTERDAIQAGHVPMYVEASR